MTEPMSEERLAEIEGAGGEWDGDTVVELLAEVRRLRDERDDALRNAGKESGFWGRATSRAIDERDSLASKLAVAVEALRVLSVFDSRSPHPEHTDDFKSGAENVAYDAAKIARTALAAVERKEGTGE